MGEDHVLNVDLRVNDHRRTEQNLPEQCGHSILRPIVHTKKRNRNR